MSKFWASIALTIYLFIGTASLSAQPSKEYFDADRGRVQKLLNVRIRKQIEAECKRKAKKFYSAIHFQKRGAYVKDCIEHSLVPLRRGLMGVRPAATEPATASLLAPRAEG